MLQIVGTRTWRLPAWLERLLPHFNVEGLLPAPALPVAEEAALALAHGSGAPARAGAAPGGAEG